MKRLLVFLLFFAAAALPDAAAQQAPAASVVPAVYGTAFIVQTGMGYCFLTICDGVTPNPYYKHLLEEDGKERRFADEAAVLNYLYSQGWEVLPNGINEGTNHYLLKRRTP